MATMHGFNRMSHRGDPTPREHDEAKLPKWAQQRLHMLREELTRVCNENIKLREMRAVHQKS